MLRDHERRHRRPSLLACSGALLAAAAVGLAAYAAHAATGAGSAQSNLHTAAAFAFGHGLALAALAPTTQRSTGQLGLALLLLGTLLFAGSLALGAFIGSSTRLAPAGGMALMAGWVVWGLDALRR